MISLKNIYNISIVIKSLFGLALLVFLILLLLVLVFLIIFERGLKVLFKLDVGFFKSIKEIFNERISEFFSFFAFLAVELGPDFDSVVKLESSVGLVGDESDTIDFVGGGLRLA